MRSRAFFARPQAWAVLFALVSWAAPAVAADAPPRWKFKEGETLNYVLERNADGKMSLAGNEFGIQMGMAFDTTWKCKSVNDDGSANLEQTVDRIRISMASPLSGEVKYDSAGGPAPAGPIWTLLGPMVEGMLNQTFTLRVAPNGAVSDIELPAKLKEAFAKQVVGQNRQAGMGIGGNAFNEKGIKQLISQAVVPLPETAEKDVTWTQAFENEIPFLGKEIAETTYSLAGDEDVDGKKLTKISSKTEVLFEPEANPRAEMEIVEQDSSATAYFDAAAGHLVKSDGKQTTVKEISGQQEVSQNITETFKMYLGKSPAAEAERKE
ncbi:MAG: DUF6263 family protein [Pirellulales bacterium]